MANGRYNVANVFGSECFKSRTFLIKLHLSNLYHTFLLKNNSKGLNREDPDMRVIEGVKQFKICFKKCGEWTFLFATNVANVKLLLDTAVLDASNDCHKSSVGKSK